MRGLAPDAVRDAGHLKGPEDGRRDHGPGGAVYCSLSVPSEPVEGAET